MLLWMAANAGYRTPRYLTFKQALELGGNVRKGEHGTRVYFVKRLQVADKDGEEGETRIVPMMREYTVFNVDQCEHLPDRVLTLGEVKERNPDGRDPTIDGFLARSGANIRKGMAKPITGRAMTSSACHVSKLSRALRIFTEPRFTNLVTGLGTSRALIVTCATASANAPMRQRNWSPSYARPSFVRRVLDRRRFAPRRLYPNLDWSPEGRQSRVLHRMQQGAGRRRLFARAGAARAAAGKGSVKGIPTRWTAYCS